MYYINIGAATTAALHTSVRVGLTGRCARRLGRFLGWDTVDSHNLNSQNLKSRILTPRTTVYLNFKMLSEGSNLPEATPIFPDRTLYHTAPSWYV